MVVLDTNIIIDHLRQSTPKESLLMAITKKYTKDNLAISTITIQELYEGISAKQEENERFMLATIAPLKVLSYTYETAQLSGEIARDLDKPIEFADAAIAATTIVHGASLYTLNKKDFNVIRDLILY
jgi:predicted nucleic acid-binding protein